MRNFSLICLLLLLFFSNLCFAQRDNDKRELRNQIDSIRKQKFIENVNVDEETANRFFEMFKEHNKNIRLLNKERKEITKSIENNPDASDIELKIDSLLEIDTKITERRKAFISELKTILTPQQIAKTIILQKNFDRQFRKELLKQRRKRGIENN